MALKLADLRAMADEELVRAYDEAAPRTGEGLARYRDELNRRAAERDTAAMRHLTLWTVRLAVVSVVVALLALVVAVFSLLPD